MDFFNKYLKGKILILYTDHKPLEKLGHLHSKMLNRLETALLCYSVQKGFQHAGGLSLKTSEYQRNHSQYFRIPPFSNRPLRPSNAGWSFARDPDVQEQEPMASTRLETGSSILHHPDRQGVPGQEQGGLGKIKWFQLPKDSAVPTFKI